MKNIWISDANIFIDLISCGLLAQFFSLPWIIKTPDFVLSEIKKNNDKEQLLFFVNTKKLEVCHLNQKEMGEVIVLRQKFGKRLSFTDYTIWYLAKRDKIAILSGDKLVKKVAEQEGINVNGILFILDSLIEKRIITPKVAKVKLMRLRQCNCYLPDFECEKRLERWS